MEIVEKYGNLLSNDIISYSNHMIIERDYYCVNDALKCSRLGI